jgi:hypothetical protein
MELDYDAYPETGKPCKVEELIEKTSKKLKSLWNKDLPDPDLVEYLEQSIDRDLPILYYNPYESGVEMGKVVKSLNSILSIERKDIVFFFEKRAQSYSVPCRYLEDNYGVDCSKGLFPSGFSRLRCEDCSKYHASLPGHPHRAAERYIARIIFKKAGLIDRID